MTMASPRVFHHHALELVALSEPETLVTRLAALRVPTLFIAGVPDQPDRFAAAVAGLLATL